MYTWEKTTREARSGVGLIGLEGLRQYKQLVFTLAVWLPLIQLLQLLINQTAKCCHIQVVNKSYSGL